MKWCAVRPIFGWVNWGSIWNWAPRKHDQNQGHVLRNCFVALFDPKLIWFPFILDAINQIEHLLWVSFERCSFLGSRKKVSDINFHLPKRLQEISLKRNFKLVTFGTIMEKFDGIATSNPYIFSKRKYLDYLIQSGHTKSNALHLQIHTWYGGANLKPFMFLGEM